MTTAGPGVVASMVQMKRSGIQENNVGIRLWLSPRGKRQLFVVCVAIMSIFLAYVYASAEEVRLGMSQEEVVRLLGEPDRKAVLVGKELRDLDNAHSEDVARLRLVYFYDTLGLEVWFKESRVTGVTRHGVSTR